MHKLNFKTPLFMLGTIPVVNHLNQQQLVNSELAQHLMSMNTGNALKNTSICLRIFEKGEVELDQPDLDFLEAAIKKCQTAPDYLIAAALEEINRAKES